jgi:hypothetical protein
MLIFVGWVILFSIAVVVRGLSTIGLDHIDNHIVKVTKSIVQVFSLKYVIGAHPTRFLEKEV